MFIRIGNRTEHEKPFPNKNAGSVLGVLLVAQDSANCVQNRNKRNHNVVKYSKETKVAAGLLVAC